MIIYLHYMWGVGVTGDDYIPPLYVGSGCHWEVIIYLHYMWGVGVTGDDYIPPLYVGSGCHWG